MPVYVGADNLAEVFGISERSVQRLVIYEGMRRSARGQYDYFICKGWYIRYHHRRICGCAGPRDGVESCRRELLDHIVALNERHLKRLLSDYVRYHHEARTHLGLGKGTPDGRIPSVASGRVLAQERLGGCTIVTIEPPSSDRLSAPSSNVRRTRKRVPVLQSLRAVSK